jgi:hypothetical protein
LFAAVLVVTVCGSCGSRDTMDARTTVDGFLEALRRSDREEASRLSPGIRDADDPAWERLSSAMTRVDRWSIAGLTRRGDRAQARVVLYEGAQETEIALPLSRTDGLWTVDSLTTTTTRIDLVPLER